MGPLDSLLDSCRDAVRAVMNRIAKILHVASGGHLTPNMVTLTGLIAHVGIAYLIAARHPLWAAALLLLFGLFDALDGALARLQGKVSPAGMLLDASTDRMKEVLLYSGIAYFFIEIDHPYTAVWALGACGASLCVSYVKAKGETAVAGKKLSTQEVNRLFQDGLMRFEIRMFLLIVGLVTALLPEMLVIITVFSGMTAFGRLVRISRKV